MDRLYGTGTLIRLSLSNIYEYKQNNRTQNPLVWKPKALTKQTTNERRIKLSADWQSATENGDKTIWIRWLWDWQSATFMHFPQRYDDKRSLHQHKTLVWGMCTIKWGIRCLL